MTKTLRGIGFFPGECSFIFKNFSEDKIKQALHYHWWLSKYRGGQKYEKSYVYTLLYNFDLSKTYLDYQNYLKNKKDAAKLVLPKKKSYSIEKYKVGEDVKVDSSPKNILDFIRHGKKAKDSS